MREMSWHEDLWGPFSQVAGAFFITFLPALIVQSAVAAAAGGAERRGGDRGAGRGGGVPGGAADADHQRHLAQPSAGPGRGGDSPVRRLLPGARGGSGGVHGGLPRRGAVQPGSTMRGVGMKVGDVGHSRQRPRRLRPAARVDRPDPRVLLARGADVPARTSRSSRGSSSTTSAPKSPATVGPARRPKRSSRSGGRPGSQACRPVTGIRCARSRFARRGGGRRTGGSTKSEARNGNSRFRAFFFGFAAYFGFRWWAPSIE